MREALALGVGTGRLAGRDLARPFHGVRAHHDPVGVWARCRAYAARMRVGDAFSDATAAELWGMPLAASSLSPEIHVTSPPGVRAARGRGVLGHTRALAAGATRARNGLILTSPAETWVHLSATTPWWDLVAVGDYIVTGLPFASVLPLATLDELHAADRRAHGNRGAIARRRALEHIDVGPLSRPESLSLILFRLAGLPRPLVNEPVLDERGSFLALPDATWPDFGVVYEYEGDHHRRVGQFRRDVSRAERLIDHGWTVVRSTADDLFDRPDVLAQRVAQRLRAGGWDGKARRLPRMGPMLRG